MTEDQAYVIPLDYGDRSGTREFLRALLTRYDRDTLVGCTLHVNNHPYYLEAYLCLNFWKEHDFEGWLAAKFPRLKRDFRFLSSEIMEAVFKKSFNVIGFTDPDLLKVQVSDLANGIFLFPSREVMDREFGKPVAASTYSVFLSHSSADKPLVNGVFEALHKAGIRAWYDRYEIAPGDSITSKINDGLSRSDLGLIFLSKSFLGVSADVKLTHCAEVKVTHLGHDGGLLKAADVDSGASSGDTSDGPQGRECQSNREAVGLLAQHRAQIPARPGRAALRSARAEGLQA